MIEVGDRLLDGDDSQFEIVEIHEKTRASSTATAVEVSSNGEKLNERNHKVKIFKSGNWISLGFDEI